MRKPDFFVVGAAKSGTTALWKYFQQHPELFVTSKIEHKELGYYSHQYGVKSRNWYLNYFKNAEETQLIGEVCHVYLTSEESPQLIKEDVPQAKIIILLRNPVARALSLYNWMVMHGFEKATSFEDALKQEEAIDKGEIDVDKLLHKYKKNYHYFKTGLYSKQVARYYEAFGNENVLVLEYADFKNQHEQELQRIFDFLGVSRFKVADDKTINKSKTVFSIKVQYWARKLLMGKYRKNPYLSRIAKFILEVNVLNKQPKKMQPATRETLIENYKKDIEQLSLLTGIDFEKKWNE